mgnify:CR=1 FL=1
MNLSLLFITLLASHCLCSSSARSTSWSLTDSLDSMSEYSGNSFSQTDSTISEPFTKKILKAVYSIPGMQPTLQRVCFEESPESLISRELVDVNERGVVKDAIQVLLWAACFEFLKMMFFNETAHDTGLIYRFLYAGLAAEMRFAFVLLLQRYENQARELYSEYGWGLFGPYRNMAYDDQDEVSDPIRETLRNPVTNALFNWSNNTKARWMALMKVLLVSLAILIIRRVIFLDSFFILNGIVDLLWLASFWVIILIEYIKPTSFLLPFLIGIQTFVFH